LALGLPLNGLGLWVFCCRLRRWTETRVYMANLVAAAFLLLLSLPGALHTLDQEQGARDGPLCGVLQSLYDVNTYVSTGLLTAIAVDRYSAPRFPLRTRAWRSPHRAALACLALWLLVSGAVALWGSPVGVPAACGRESLLREVPHPGRQDPCLLPALLPPLTAGPQLLLRASALAPAPPQEAGRTLKALRVVAANLATFVLCFLPLHVALMAKLVAKWTEAADPTIQHVTDFVRVTARVANANCCLDAISYYFVATEFQEEVGA
ncbi:hypothetical protein PANDA_012303, partial [Ailuropoda melanoleuca]